MACASHSLVSLEAEERNWQAAADALHQSQQGFIALLERSAGLTTPASTVAVERDSSTVVQTASETLDRQRCSKLQRALTEACDAHAISLREGKSRELALEAQLAEMVQTQLIGAYVV